MIFCRCRRHHFGLGQHGSGHLFKPFHHLVGTQRGGLAVDDERHGPTREHNAAIHLTYSWDVCKRIVGIVGWIQLQEHRHVIDEMTVFRTRHNALAFHLYSVERINLRL